MSRFYQIPAFSISGAQTSCSTIWNLVFNLRISHQYHIHIIDVRELHTCICSNHTLVYSRQLYTEGGGAHACTHTYTHTQRNTNTAYEHKNVRIVGLLEGKSVQVPEQIQINIKIWFSGVLRFAT